MKLRHYSRSSSRTARTGFSLVEMLVYVSLLVIVMTASVTYLFSLNDLLTQYRLQAEVYRSGTAALEQVVLSLRQGESLDMAWTVPYPSTTGTLVVNGATREEFAHVGDQLQLTEDGTALGDITGSLVAVDGFTVFVYDTGWGEFARVALELRAQIGDQSFSTTLYGGAVVRGAL